MYAFEASFKHASFNCEKAVNYVEKTICKNDSYSLKKLDNLLAREYKLLLSQDLSNPSLKKNQLSWIKARNECKDVKCIEASYNNRIKEIRLQLLSSLNKNNTTCFTNPFEAIFKEASKYEDKEIVSKIMRISIAQSDGMPLDLDLDGKADPTLQIQFAKNICRATNCRNTYMAFIKIGNCYHGVKLNTLRSTAIPPSSLDKRVYNAYNKGNYSTNIAILTSYDVSGCAGSSGTRTYSALNAATKQYESFLYIEYECDKEVRFKEKNYNN